MLFEVKGFGAPAEATPMQLQPDMFAASWGCTIQLLGAGLGTRIDEVGKCDECEYATEAFDIATGRIAVGGQSAMWFEIRGMAAWQPAIDIEHVARLCDDIPPAAAHSTGAAPTAWRLPVSQAIGSTSAPDATGPDLDCRQHE